MLASDLNNPEYANPQNPDSMLQVEFYMHAAEDTWKTQETGIKAFRAECPFIRISIPGNSLSIVERPANGTDPKRFPREWLTFQMATGQVDQSADLPTDTPLSKLGLDAETMRQLEYLRFRSVEKLAHANDMQIQGVGMGGIGLRDKARMFLAEQKATTAQQAVDERDARIKSLEDKLDRLLSLTEEKRGPGRPRNEDRQAA
jgi:hypothetical protein